MRITTRKTIQLTDNIFDYSNVVEHEYFDYSGPIELSKGGSSKAEQQAADQQRQLENQLAQQQLNLMQQQLGSVNATVDPIIQSIISGQTPPVLQPLQSALTASYTNDLANTYRNLAGNINQNLVARGISGGNMAGSGDLGKDFGFMAGMLGQQQQAGATNAAQIMNQNRLGLLQNDLGMKLGIANQYGSTFGNANQASIGSLNAGVTAAGNADQAQSSWMGPVFGAIGSLGGQAMKTWGCWVAAELYGGWSDPRTQFVRTRLAMRARKELTFRLIGVFYALTGRTIAKLVRRSNTARRIAARLFNGFLRSEQDYILNELVHSKLSIYGDL